MHSFGVNGVYVWAEFSLSACRLLHHLRFRIADLTRLLSATGWSRSCQAPLLPINIYEPPRGTWVREMCHWPFCTAAMVCHAGDAPSSSAEPTSTPRPGNNADKRSHAQKDKHKSSVANHHRKDRALRKMAGGP